MSVEPEPAAVEPKPFDEKTWAMFCHLTGFAGHLVPFGNVLLPYLLWQDKRNRSEFVDRQGREAANFQATMLLFMLICIPLIFVLIGIPLLILLALFHAIFTIVGTIRAVNGVDYRYPFAIPFFGRNEPAWPDGKGSA